MTEPTDIDALIAEARVMQSEVDRTTILRHGFDDGSRLIERLADHLESTMADLARAREVIEKAIACEEHTHRIMTDRKPTREDSSLTWRILTEYARYEPVTP